MTTKKKQQQHRFRSKFEQLIWNTLLDKKVKVQYEVDKLKYTVPESVHSYTPDFKLRDKVYLETKGIFSVDDREKMLIIRDTYPEYKFYLCFYNANAKLYKGSKSTYADWAVKHGFEYCHAPKGIPEEWLKK